jgi:hypothetical protein
VETRTSLEFGSSASKSILRRMSMKRKIVRAKLSMISLATVFVVVVPAVHAAETCSNTKAAGDWGFTLNGTLILPTGPVPGAASGRVSADAAGNISGTEARNVGGGFANETITGSWTVNSDCTATLTANIYESGVLVRISVLAVVFVDNSSKIRAVQESLTLPDGTAIPVVITFEADKLFRENGH